MAGVEGGQTGPDRVVEVGIGGEEQSVEQSAPKVSEDHASYAGRKVLTAQTATISKIKAARLRIPPRCKHTLRAI